MTLCLNVVGNFLFDTPQEHCEHDRCHMAVAVQQVQQQHRYNKGITATVQQFSLSAATVPIRSRSEQGLNSGRHSSSWKFPVHPLMKGFTVFQTLCCAVVDTRTDTRSYK